MVSTYIKTDKKAQDTDPCLRPRRIGDYKSDSWLLLSLHTSVRLLYIAKLGTTLRPISFLTESPKPAASQRNPHPEVWAGEEGLIFFTEESCLQQDGDCYIPSRQIQVKAPQTSLWNFVT